MASEGDKALGDGILEIRPPGISFQTFSNRTSVKLINTSEVSPVSYKVKTTTPKRYVVRPSFGVIHPGASEEITILFVDKEVSVEKRNELKDKFQVQTLVITKEQAALDPEQLKSQWNNKSENDITLTRLKVYFQAPSQSISDTPTFPPTIPPQSRSHPTSSFEPSEAMSKSDSQDDLVSSSSPSSRLEPRVTSSSSSSRTISPIYDFYPSSSSRSTSAHEDSEESSAVRDLHALRDEYNRSLIRTNMILVELKKENESLKNQLIKEKEEGIRQRKVIASEVDLQQRQSLAMTPSQKFDLSNRYIQLLIVAIIFFILGKML